MKNHRQPCQPKEGPNPRPTLHELWICNQIALILGSRPLSIAFTNNPNTLWMLTCPNFNREGSHASFAQFKSRIHNPILHQAMTLYPLEAPVFLRMTAYHQTPICCGIHPLDTQAPLLLYYFLPKGSSYPFKERLIISRRKKA
jgi:hypothetical protein